MYIYMCVCELTHTCMYVYSYIHKYHLFGLYNITYMYFFSDDRILDNQLVCFPGENSYSCSQH